jgi:membrane protease YdiL (CAAX protease family)
VVDAMGVAGWGYLVLLGGVLPWAASRSARQLARGPLPPRGLFFVSVIVQQLALGGVALWVAGREGISWPWGSARPLSAAVVAVGLTALLLIAGRPLWRAAIARRERRAYLTMPRTPAERVLWLGVSLAAGVAEEVAYRAVLYALLLRLVGSPIAAVLGGAAIFGLGHLMQGRRDAAIVGGVGLLLQGAVWYTGGLASAIVAHVVYDAVAGLAYGRYGARSGYPIDGIPLPAAEPVTSGAA